MYYYIITKTKKMSSKKCDEDYVPEDDFEEEIQEKKYLIKLLKDSIMEQDLKRKLLEKKLEVKKLEKEIRSQDKFLPRLPRKMRNIVKKEKVETIYNPITNKRIKKTKRSVKSIETQVKKFNSRYNPEYLSKLFDDMSF